MRQEAWRVLELSVSLLLETSLMKVGDPRRMFSVKLGHVLLQFLSDR